MNRLRRHLPVERLQQYSATKAEKWQRQVNIVKNAGYSAKDYAQNLKSLVSGENCRERSDFSDFQYCDSVDATDSDSIRLLEIEPGQFEDEIFCSLHTVSLRDDPEYEALSYSWGRDKAEYEVYIRNGAQPEPETLQQKEKPAAEEEEKEEDDEEEEQNSEHSTMIVKPNLRSALRHLRLTDKSRFIWADAICIDQDNLMERNHQVSLMNKVYSNAQRTLIWIGENGNGSDRMFDTLRRIAADDDDQSVLSELSSATETGDDIPVYMAVIASISNRDWFDRLWTVQEVLLAKEAVIICGRQTMPWKDFARSIDMLGCSVLAPGRKGMLIDQGDFDNVLTLASGSLEASRTSTGDHWDRFTDFLLLLRKRYSSNPSDKVFGLLGLVTYPDGSQLLKIDYSLPTIRVFEQTSRLVLKNTNSLDILAAGGSTELKDDDDENLALSWIGDFVYRKRPTVAFRHVLGSNVRFLRPELSPRDGDIDLKGDILEVRGHLVDELARLSTVLENINSKEVDMYVENQSDRWDEITAKQDEAYEALEEANKDASSFRKKYNTTVAKVKMTADVSAEIGRSLRDFGRVLADDMLAWQIHTPQVFMDWEEMAGISSPAHKVDNGAAKKSPKDVDWQAIAATRETPRREEYWRTLACGSLLPPPSLPPLTKTSSGSIFNGSNIGSRGTSSSSSDIHRKSDRNIKKTNSMTTTTTNISSSSGSNTVTNDDDDERSASLEHSRAHFERFFEMIEPMRQLRRRGVTEKTLTERARNFVVLNTAHMGNHLDYARLLTHAQGRRLAETRAGRLVLVPEDAQRGDRLAFCRGARVPLVLRPRGPDEPWRFVGEAYAHALADYPLQDVEWKSVKIS